MRKIHLIKIANTHEMMYNQAYRFVILGEKVPEQAVKTCPGIFCYRFAPAEGNSAILTAPEVTAAPKMPIYSLIIV